MRAAFALLLFACPLLSQSQPGLAPDWDIRKALEGVVSQSARLQPVLDQMRPKDWIADGAPAAYLAQWQSVQTQNKTIAQAAQALLARPEQSVPVLQLLFRMQSFDVALRSVEEGLRKYQNPSLADLLLSVAAEGSSTREHLQQYAVDLVTEHEQQFQVADREAQRCRESLAKAPVRKPGSK